jgi:hypothetical protein
MVEFWLVIPMFVLEDDPMNANQMSLLAEAIAKGVMGKTGTKNESENNCAGASCDHADERHFDGSGG